MSPTVSTARSVHDPNFVCVDRQNNFEYYNEYSACENFHSRLLIWSTPYICSHLHFTVSGVLQIFFSELHSFISGVLQINLIFEYMEYIKY